MRDFLSDLRTITSCLSFIDSLPEFRQFFCMNNLNQGPGEVAASTKNQPVPAVRYCLYARKSTEAEERQALSIDSQIKEMKRLAERDNLRVVAVRTESHSAKSSGQRDVFNLVLEEIKLGKYNGLLTWAPDRLSRNAGDLGRLVDLMDNRLLLDIRTYNQNFSNSPNEKFLLMILGSQAKLENDNRGINVKRGLRAVVERGLWPGVAPLGYRNEKRIDRKCHLILDLPRAYIIKMMYENAANGWSPRKIKYWLRSELGFLTSNKNFLSLSSVQKVLTSPFYYGEFEYPKGSGKWYKGKHKPIVTKELFESVRCEIAKRRHPGQVFYKNFAYTKLMKCGFCGSGISAMEKFKSLKDGSFSKYIYYGCTKAVDASCKSRYLREDELVRQLRSLVDRLTIDDLGVRGRMDAEVEKAYRFHRDVAGIPEGDGPLDVDIKRYVKFLLEKGTVEEKRHILLNLRSRLIVKNAVVYLDTAPEGTGRASD